MGTSALFFLREHLDRRPSPMIVLCALEALSDGEGVSHSRALRRFLEIVR